MASVISLTSTRLRNAAQVNDYKMLAQMSAARERRIWERDRRSRARERRTGERAPRTSTLMPRADASNLRYRGTLADDLVAPPEYRGTRVACLCKRPPVPRHACRGGRRSCREPRHSCRVHSTPLFGHAALLRSTAELVPSTAGRSPRSSERNCCAFLSDAVRRGHDRSIGVA